MTLREKMIVGAFAVMVLFGIVVLGMNQPQGAPTQNANVLSLPANK